MSMSGHQSARMKSDTWLTPPEWVKALGPFDLDPACPPVMPWPTAARMLSARGLEEPWEGRVWLNPPYGKEAGAWVKKLAEHGDGIALVFSRTDVRWWHDVAPSATAVCFIRGRLTFIAGAGQSAPGNSGGPSALLAYGDECAAAVGRSGLGLTYREALC